MVKSKAPQPGPWIAISPIFEDLEASILGQLAIFNVMLGS
jgi:hypothetical protein